MYQKIKDTMSDIRRMIRYLMSLYRDLTSNFDVLLTVHLSIN